MAAWIATIADEEASPELSACLDAVRAPSGDVGNVMRVHSLRPHTMTGHQALYMSVLHHEGNRLPAWFQEVVASWVSLLNRCDYSVVNHFANARHLIADDGRADAVLAALGSPRYAHFHACGNAPGEIAISLFDTTISFDGEVFWESGRLKFLDRPRSREILERHPESANAFDMRWDIGI